MFPVKINFKMVNEYRQFNCSVLSTRKLQVFFSIFFHSNLLYLKKKNWDPPKYLDPGFFGNPEFLGCNRHELWKKPIVKPLKIAERWLSWSSFEWFNSDCPKELALELILWGKLSLLSLLGSLVFPAVLGYIWGFFPETFQFKNPIYIQEAEMYPQNTNKVVFWYLFCLAKPKWILLSAYTFTTGSISYL